MKLDGFSRTEAHVILSPADIRLLADLCNDLGADVREYNPAHKESLGAALEVLEQAMTWLPAPGSVA